MVMNTTFSWPCFFILAAYDKNGYTSHHLYNVVQKKVPYPQRIKHFYDYRDI